MSMLWACGFELQSATALMEYDTNSGTPSISTSIKRSGAASLRCNASGTAVYMQHQYSTGIDSFLSAWVYFVSFPGSNAIIMRLWDGAAGQRIEITSGGQLQFYDGAGTQQGSNTAALSLNTWYNIQIAGQDTPTYQEARLNGTVIGTNSTTGFSGGFIRLGVQSAVTMDMYIDDVVVCDDLTGNMATYPEVAMRVGYLRPNAAGNSNTFRNNANAVGDANNYTECDETTPDDTTTKIQRNTGASNRPSDQYNIEAPSVAGIDVDDKIFCVAVGARGGSDSATSAAGRNANVGIRSSTTDAWSGSIDYSINGYTTNADPVPRVPKYVAYVDPADSAAWTYSKVDSLQVGVRANSSATTVLRFTALWLLVLYVQSVSSKQLIVRQDIKRASYY